MTTASSEGCTHEHALLFAAPGERIGDNRLWTVVADGFAAQEARWPWGESIPLPRGTRLRYDQRDYDRSWRMEGWDRFCVLDGPDAGRCVFLSNPNCDGPVSQHQPHGMIAPLLGAIRASPASVDWATAWGIGPGRSAAIPASPENGEA